ncbi:taste receptor type 2 member 8-like [Hyperolius riggenbachi]|uniref:taste receptor type 2 member 8-like n=1 Tax=Hyperolius riggenbachi TaxID=752182 RepID=UPI0035A3CE76
MGKENNQSNPQSSPSSSDKNLTQYEILSLAIVGLETLIGIVVNVYIMMVNLVDLMVRRKLGSGDIILTCLGLFRFDFQLLVLTYYLLSFIASDENNSQSTVNKLQYVWLFFSDINMWLAALLCTFYCVRIVTVQNRVFLFLKTHFDMMVPWFLLVSAGVSALLSSPFAYTGLNSVVNMSKFDKNQNTPSFILGGSDFATFSTLSAVGTTIPFVLFCVSTGMVVGSLLMHARKVKGQERTGFREPSLKAHYRAVKMMGAFFLFFSLYMVTFNLYASGTLSSGIEGSVCTMAIGAYPSLHSVLLVIGNHKLKQPFIKILQKGKCYQAEVTQTETLDT